MDLTRPRIFIFLFFGGFLFSSSAILTPVFADTIQLKNNKEIKGLVVENHADRIILSTEKGEIPILLSGIKSIQYDEPEQNFMQIGRAYEAERKYGEALAYYQKALDLNPEFDEAKKAASAMKSRFWAASTEGPQSEMDKQQQIYDSWGQGSVLVPGEKKQISQNASTLRKNSGLVLVKRGDWVYAGEVGMKSDALLAGMKRGDRLVGMDGESLRYLSLEVIVQKMLAPRYSSFSLEYERMIKVKKVKFGEFSNNLGMKLKLDQQGTTVEKIDSGGPAAAAGLKEGDLVSAVNEESTRYLPLSKVNKIIKDSRKGVVVFSVRRSAILTRR